MDVFQQVLGAVSLVAIALETAMELPESCRVVVLC